MSTCYSECDCDCSWNPLSHTPDCASHRVCDEGRYCDKHMAEQEAAHAYLRHVPLGAVTGRLSDQDKQDLRDAGRGHLIGGDL